MYIYFFLIWIQTEEGEQSQSQYQAPISIDQMTLNFAFLGSEPVDEIVQDQWPRKIWIIINNLRKANLLQDHQSRVN